MYSFFDKNDSVQDFEVTMTVIGVNINQIKKSKSSCVLDLKINCYKEMQLADYMWEAQIEILNQKYELHCGQPCACDSTVLKPNLDDSVQLPNNQQQIVFPEQSQPQLGIKQHLQQV